MERIRFNHVGRAGNLSWPRAVGRVIDITVLMAIMCVAAGCWQKVGLEENQSATRVGDPPPPPANEFDGLAGNSQSSTPSLEDLPTPDPDTETEVGFPNELPDEAEPADEELDQAPFADTGSSDNPFADESATLTEAPDTNDVMDGDQPTDTDDPPDTTIAAAQSTQPEQPAPADVNASPTADKAPDEPTSDTAGSSDAPDELFYALDPPATSSDDQNSTTRAGSSVDELADTNSAANDLFRNLPPSVLPPTIQRRTPPLPPEPKPAATPAPTDTAQAESTTPLPPATTRRAAWLLGSKLSLAALARDAGAPREQADGLFAEATTLAEYLNLQLPRMPSPTSARSDGVSRETLDYLLPLARQLGRNLDNTRGLDHAALFELAFKSNMLLVLYGPEERVVRAIAQAVERATANAELPSQLSRPILDTLEQRPPADVVQQAVFTLHQNVYEYLAQR